MAITSYIINSNDAQYTDAEFSAIQTELYSEGVFNMNATNDDLEVAEHSPANLSVDVNTGGVLIEFLKSTVIWKVIAKNLASENLSINANAGGTNRVDAVVMHIKQTTPNELKNNVAELLVIDGTGATALADAAIDSSVGDTNWYRLADITVAPAATQILTADIADTREAIHIGRDDGGYANIYRGDGSEMIGILKNPLDSNLTVDTDATYDIGEVAVRIDNIYAVNFYGDGTNITNVTTDALVIPLFVGEAVAVGEVCYFDKWETFANSQQVDITIAAADTQKEMAIAIVGNGVSASTINVALKKAGLPVDNLQFTIETDDSGKPSGTLAHANATGSLAGASITTSYVDTTLNFAGAFTLTDKTLYWVRFKRSTGLSDAVNYYIIGTGIAASTRVHSHITYNASTVTWSALQTNRIYIDFDGCYNGMWALASAVNTYFTEGLLMMASESISARDSGKFMTSGVDTSRTGLVVNEEYFLSDTPGAISATAGTISKKIGEAVDTDALVLTGPEEFNEKSYNFTTPIVVTNSSAETEIFSYTIRGGLLSSNNLLEGFIDLRTYISWNTVRDITFRLKYGSTTVITLVVPFSGSEGYSENRTTEGYLKFLLSANNANNAQKGQMFVDNHSAYDGAGSYDYIVFGKARGTSTEDSTSDLTLTLTMQWEVADSNYDFYADQGYVKLIK